MEEDCGHSYSDREFEEVRDERDALLKAMNPRRWNQKMMNAWHRAIPDVQKAFEDLMAAAMDTGTEPGP